MPSWSWPVSPVYVTSPWDPARRHPVTGKIQPHTGTDFRAHEGAPLYAVHDGVVVRSLYDAKVAGNYTRIDCGGGIWAGYSHQSERLVRVGDRVRRGQQIGKAGATGSATAAHLHFEIDVAGTKVDPVPFLAARTGASLVAHVGVILGSVAVAPDGSLPDPLTPEDDVPSFDDPLGVNPATHKPETFGEQVKIASSYAFQSWELLIAQRAQIAALVGAVAALSKGEPFDEAKLLASIEQSAAAGIKAGFAQVGQTLANGAQG